MPDRKINVSEAMDETIAKAAKSCKMTKKEYVEMSCMYFISRDINPKKIKQGEILALQHHVTKEINRAIGFIITMEQAYIINLLRDIKVLGLRVEIMEGNMFKLIDDTCTALKVKTPDYPSIKKSNKEYFDKRIKVLEESLKKLKS